ncbi:hypothetical protein KIPB_001984 [Kipferlia bialata]|uniref:Uncharacterized protein n=1 Tax=Kipferlia bialata TaxID=797122 RepID=A0A391NSA6_9EUKA|nr:hypothetical protein KIPB_001984 [Kipferlia bialata]|eukprot:g1984.t1
MLVEGPDDVLDNTSSGFIDAMMNRDDTPPSACSFVVLGCHLSLVRSETHTHMVYPPDYDERTMDCIMLLFGSWSPLIDSWRKSSENSWQLVPCRFLSPYSPERET